MAYRRLFIFVEGPDDERFLNHLVGSALKDRYDLIVVRRYANERPAWVSNFVRSIEGMNADCILLADINAEPCVTAKKQKLQERYGIEDDRVIVVVMEIESWYLAGLDDEASAQLGVPFHKSTDALTKEDFNRLMPQRSGSRIDFMVEILKRFSTETARRKNRSFRYFARKYAL